MLRRSPATWTGSAANRASAASASTPGVRRYDAHDLDGLRDRSQRFHIRPNATRTEVVGKIIYLRQRYHFGPAKIAMYLRRYHEVQITNSGVWRILKRLELNRLPGLPAPQPHNRRWKRYEKQLPGHRSSWTSSSSSRYRAPPGQEVLPVHRHRRLHPAADAADLPQAEPADRYPVPGLPAPATTVPGRGHPDRQRASVSARATTGRSWTKAAATTTSSPEPRDSTARWSTGIHRRRGVLPTPRKGCYECAQNSTPRANAHMELMAMVEHFGPALGMGPHERTWMPSEGSTNWATIHPAEEVTTLREEADYGWQAGCTGGPSLR